MRKININLSPQKEKISSALMQQVVSHTPMVGLGIIAVFFIILLLQIFGFLRMHAHSAYSQKWEQWGQKAQTIKQLKVEIASLDQKNKQLEDIATPTIDTVLILDDVFASLFKNIWFDALNYKDQSIYLKGYIVRWEEDYLMTLDKFINSLRQKEYFSSKFNKINIRTSKKAKFNNVDVLEFVLECESQISNSIKR